MMNTQRTLRLAALLSVLVFGWTPRALAQLDDDLEVRMDVTRLGPGGAAREGSWTGMRIEVTDRGLAPQRDIVLRARIQDPDGDEVHFDRVVTSNANLPQAFWLYAMMPNAVRADSVDILAYEAIETPGDSQFGFRAGRLIGRTEVSLQRMLPANRGVIGVVGPVRFGLDDYGPTGSFSGFLPLGHEITVVASGLEVADLPDRWHGLAAFDVIVWGSTRERTDPGTLSPDKAQAVREWIERGGHLVIVLPSIGQEWFSEAGNPLASLLPRVETPESRQGVDLNAYRAMLTFEREVALPTDAIVRTFRAAEGAAAHDAMPILAGPDGEAVVVRRLIGGGAVTLIGFDLGVASLRNLGLPRAEVFWHRVLGRRGELASAEEIATSQNIGATARMESRTSVPFDVDIADQIAMTGTAAFGVGLGVLVFVAYWLIAGPVGYFLLGLKGLKRHAWVAFAASIAVFTGVAWAGASVLRPRHALVRHVTIAHAVYGQDVVRARSWMAMLVPSYGDAAVEIADEAQGGRSNTMAYFEVPGATAGLGRFPDNRSYRIESRSPGRMVFPARSTVKEFTVDWAGTSSWEMPAPIGEPGELEAPSLRLIGDEEFDAGGARIDHDVRGVLAHNLPGDLEDVVILVNRGQVTLGEGQRLRGQLSANIFAYELAQPWAPGTRLSLSDVTKRAGADAVQRRQLAFVYLSQLIESERVSNLGVLRSDPRRFPERLKALALFPQLEPPRFDGAPGGVGDRLARRSLTHGYDLGMWFTQPCVMVLGQLRESGDKPESLIPVSLQGERVRSEGRTLVMWVYPLAAEPPLIRGAE